MGAPRRFAFVAAIFALYEWFVVSAIVSEAIAASLVAVAVYALQRRLTATAPVRARASVAFVRPFVTRVLPSVLTESFDLLGPILWRRLVLGQPVSGRWIALRYDASDRSAAHELVRRTIVVAASNLTPNALPLDVDLARGRMVLHQLHARREAAASDPRYPI